MKRSALPFVLLGFVMSSSLLAEPKVDPKRQKAQCESDASVCDNVAETEYDKCFAAGQSNCAENFEEDWGKCESDFKKCIKAIGRIQIGGRLIDAAVLQDAAILAQ